MRLKAFIIILAALGLVFIMWIVFKIVSTPNQIKMVLPKNDYQTLLADRDIIIKIDSLANYYVNDNKIALDSISTFIDSLATIGYNDSIIILDADKIVPINKIIPVMNYTKGTGKKLIIKTD